MSESDEDKPRRKRSATVDAPSSAVSRELNEDEIDAPSKQTLIMLAAISLTTLLLWAAGRAACNYQVPGESLTPRPVSLEERTRTAKDVGFEFAQCISSGRFEDALSLATGDAVDFVKKEQTACGACLDRKSAEKTIFSTATVLKANSVDSLVKVRTVGAPGGEVTRFFGIEREGRKWRVSRILEDAEGVTLKEGPSRDGSAAKAVSDAEDDASGEAEAQGAVKKDGEKPSGEKNPLVESSKSPAPHATTPPATEASRPAASAAPQP
jgi:hypothetical protein